MKNLKPGLIPALLVFVLAGCAHTRSGNGRNISGDYEYYQAFGAAIITDYQGSKKDIEIPSQFRGLKVFAIDKNAFAGKGLTRVVIPQGIRELRDSSFANNDLSVVTIPEGLSIHGDVFSSQTYPDLTGCYVVSGKKTGTYSRQGKVWYFEDTALPDFVTLSFGPGIIIDKIDDEDANGYKTGFKYYLREGLHKIALRYSYTHTDIQQELELPGPVTVMGSVDINEDGSLGTNHFVEKTFLSGVSYRIGGKKIYDVPGIKTGSNFFGLEPNADVVIIKETIIEITEL